MKGHNFLALPIPQAFYSGLSEKGGVSCPHPFPACAMPAVCLFCTSLSLTFYLPTHLHWHYHALFAAPAHEGEPWVRGGKFQGQSPPPHGFSMGRVEILCSWFPSPGRSLCFGQVGLGLCMPGS